MKPTKKYYVPGRSAKLIAWCLIALVLCFSGLDGCHSSKRSAGSSTKTHQSAGTAVLSASPNPIPPGPANQELGKTTISWNTGDLSVGDVYVKVNRSPEVFLARGQSGAVQIDWIGFDSMYEFRLYKKGNHSKLLSKLQVFRDE